MAQFTNQATLTYSGGVVTSNVATGEIVEVLSATKSALPETYSAGGVVTYIISIVNTGASDVTGVEVSDSLGAYEFDGETLYPLSYIDGTLRIYENGTQVELPSVSAGEPLVISDVTVPAGGSTIIVYSTRANEYAPLGADGSITNTATVTSGAATPFTVSETVTAEGTADLDITKTITPSAVAENGTLTYTFLIRNFGPVAATEADNVAVTDELDPVLRGLTATLDGAAMTETSDYTYSETTGLFETVAGKITVPAATYVQNADGTWTTTPGTATLTISGTLG